MIIDIIPCLNDNYSYLICDEKTNTVAIIDPSEFSTCDKIINQNYKKLDFILNTHHHYDHIGGNEQLKNKYNAKIFGFIVDKERIPGLDKLLVDNQKFKIGSLNFATLFIPGHTKGHIAFYLKEEKVIFTGDTLFSLGCGRIFEGTYEQMFNSLKLIKNFPKETMIFCGHEYTVKNSEFCLMYDPNNEKLKRKISENKKKIKEGFPTIPVSLQDEIDMNIFLRSDQKSIQTNLSLIEPTPLETFSKLRDLKDNF